jgi:hypothetical protein
MQAGHSCPMCDAPTQWFCADHRRQFFECAICGMVSVDPASHVSVAEEKAIYDLHQNHPDDAGYRGFLSQLATPLLKKLSMGMHGLDYGCGPGPTLEVMLREAGMQMQHYDPLYAPDIHVLQHVYDFVTCTEVVEHFRQPRVDWLSLMACVRVHGWLGVMTQLAPDEASRFLRWRYRDDLTHVSFYRLKTLQWLADRHHFRLEVASDRVFLMQRLV